MQPVVIKMQHEYKIDVLFQILEMKNKKYISHISLVIFLLKIHYYNDNTSAILDKIYYCGVFPYLNVANRKVNTTYVVWIMFLLDSTGLKADYHFKA